MTNSARQHAFLCPFLLFPFLLVPLSLGVEPTSTTSPSFVNGIHVGTFLAEVRKTYTTEDGLPEKNVWSVTTDESGTVFAGTSSGLARLDGDRWTTVAGHGTAITLVAPHANGLIGVADGGLYQLAGEQLSRIANIPDDVAAPGTLNCIIGGKHVLLATKGGLLRLEAGQFVPIDELNALLGEVRNVRQVATASDGRIWVAAAAGLFEYLPQSGWSRLFPRDGDRSWAPHDVRGVAFDRRGRLWFASPQGVGVRHEDGWQLVTGLEGLPQNDFTTMTAGADGCVWLGTTRGAIRFDGRQWQYRTAPRWLPDNQVRSIAVSKGGTAWFATAAGVGAIERQPTTLAEKAKFFEDEIDRYHRRTPYGFVLSVRLKNPNDKSEWTQHDSDNDGLWTAMYGAGECFAYAATKDPKARQRATDAFEALRFLNQVTQGGSHSAPKGFPARTVLPTSGPDPNLVHYTPERDRQEQKRDPLWKVISPRWPTSEDGEWYWKCDTSSDELDGHYFFNALYYDLVAETDAEKQRVRDVVVATTDHLIENGFQLIDHDGEPTRWGRFSPEDLNGDVLQGARGLNSLSILSYLRVAQHMTGDAKYQNAYDTLVDEHSYATNTLDPKRRNGPGTGNQSDDEMAYMCYYNLLNYETDPQRRRQYQWSLRWHWLQEQPERCPLFNFIYLAWDTGSRLSALRAPAVDSILADGIDTLKRIPLDRVLWSYENSHRLDIAKLPKTAYRHGEGGHLRTGHVVPIDERGLEHWNQDPWRLDAGHDGRTLTDGAAFLLPYYLGLYHNLIVE